MNKTDRYYNDGKRVSLRGVPVYWECYDLGDVVTIFDPIQAAHIGLTKEQSEDQESVDHAVAMLREHSKYGTN